MDVGSVGIEVADRGPRPLVVDVDVDFESWDYEHDGGRDSEHGPPPQRQASPSVAGLTSYVARRRGRVVLFRPASLTLEVNQLLLKGTFS